MSTQPIFLSIDVKSFPSRREPPPVARVELCGPTQRVQQGHRAARAPTSGSPGAISAPVVRVTTRCIPTVDPVDHQASTDHRSLLSTSTARDLAGRESSIDQQMAASAPNDTVSNPTVQSPPSRSAPVRDSDATRSDSHAASPSAHASMHLSSPSYAPPPRLTREEIHDPDQDVSRHSMNLGELVSVRIPWPPGVRRVLLEADASNGSAVASLISRRGGQTLHHAFEEGTRYVLEIGSQGFEQRPEALYILLVGLADHTDVDVHSAQFP